MSAKLAQIVTRSAPLHDTPVRFSPLASELIFGEIVEVLSDEGEWVKLRNARDAYEGYVHSSALSHDILQPTHKVIKRHSLVYTAPDFKTSPITHLPFMALVTPTEEISKGFIKLAGGTWIWKHDITPLELAEKDYVFTAEQFVGTPYLWGGRTGRGLDCSALAQLALTHAGLECPRDTKDQVKHFKNEIDFGNAYAPSGLERGDLVFLEGHVGLMMDETRFLNATSRTMDVRIENIHDVANEYNGGVLAVKRLG